MSKALQVLVGLGISSLATARYLHRKNLPFALMDTRESPPILAEFQKEFPEIEISLGGLDEKMLERAARIIVSPGVSSHEPLIAKQKAPIIGDIELFAMEAKAPVIAITGTNAKSTVTTLVGLMAEASGLKVQVGGNLGVPALDLLSDSAELYVLELSSFQLETTYSLKPRVATVLNVTEDHMDRYTSLKAYQDVKCSIYKQCEIAVFNADDAMTYVSDLALKKQYAFSLSQAKPNTFYLKEMQGENYLAFEDRLLLPVKSLPLLGRHNQMNALSALAIGHAYGFSFEVMLETLQSFKGLKHRCQLVRERSSVTWYNDSKGTNVGATLAAIEGLGPEIQGKIILLAGGVGKQADFSPLIPALKKYVRSMILIGEDAPLLEKTLGLAVSSTALAESMEAAVHLAANLAKPGDSVLLSPACASYDMFKNFEHRGQVFTDAVLGLS